MTTRHGGRVNNREAEADILATCALLFGGCSIVEQRGSYRHDDGRIISELSLLVRLYTDDAQAVHSYAARLARDYQQESVAVQQIMTACTFVTPEARIA